MMKTSSNVLHVHSLRVRHPLQPLLFPLLQFLLSLLSSNLFTLPIDGIVTAARSHDIIRIIMLSLNDNQLASGTAQTPRASSLTHLFREQHCFVPHFAGPGLDTALKIILVFPIQDWASSPAVLRLAERLPERELAIGMRSEAQRVIFTSLQRCPGVSPRPLSWRLSRCPR